jgi:hypothetical protein
MQVGGNGSCDLRSSESVETGGAVAWGKGASKRAEPWPAEERPDRGRLFGAMALRSSS